MNGGPNLDEARSFLQQGTGRDVKIAILDSGIEISHPRLRELRLTDDVEFVEAGLTISTVNGQGTDVFGHGTAIADIVRQVAPEAQMGSFRVLGARLRSRSLMIREGVRQAIQRGYHILNCSFGCSREDHVLMYKDWIDEAYMRGRHIVAASNNHDFTKREWPGHFPTVITVNSTDCERYDAFFSRSNHLVEFAARGQNIEVAWMGGVFKKVAGSSFAAAHLTGLLARLISCSPGLSTLEAKAILLKLATPLDSNTGIFPTSNIITNSIS
jgi:subtilisin family serine protease